MCNTLVEVGRREGKFPVFLPFYFRFVSRNRINLHLIYISASSMYYCFQGSYFHSRVLPGMSEPAWHVLSV